ncbi:MAG: GDSL-type esterase/lipase family protein [Anaerocolumna sp.]
MAVPQTGLWYVVDIKMKKRITVMMLVICLLICMFPVTAFAGDTTQLTAKRPYYESYTAIGDSICAGFTQVDYEYVNGFDMMENIDDSPKLCYARLVGKTLGSTVYNLGKCGCDTAELLDILTDENNGYYEVYWNYIGKSDLITLEIGSDDLLMATVHSILNCIGGDIANLSNQETMAMAEPLLTGDISGIADTIEMTMDINLSPEQMKAIQEALSDASLSKTLEAAYDTFCSNFQQIVKLIRAKNPMAEFVLLNYYNPYKDMNFKGGDISYNTGNVIQKFTGQMNEFTLDYCEKEEHLYVDISDTLTNIVDPHPSVAGHGQIATGIIDGLLNTAAPGKMQYYETYTAMGDSITAGFALTDYRGDFSNPRDCYVALSAKELGVDNNYNLGLLGYDTENLLNALTDPSNQYYSRFRSNLKDSDLISIDIGSNDLTMTILDMILESLGYDRDSMTADERHKIMVPLLNGLTVDTLKEDLEDNLGKNISVVQLIKILDMFRTENVDARFAEAYDEYIENWDNIIETLKDINPDASIVALGYYNASPDLNFEYGGATYNIGEVSQKYIDKMNNYITEESGEADEYIYVDTTGVELNTINGTIILDPHPSKAGHADIAKRLVTAVLRDINACTFQGGKSVQKERKLGLMG